MPTTDAVPGFVAVNSIDCEPEYLERFVTLFRSRAKAIDRRSGFISMMVLDPMKLGEPFLVVSHWIDEASFRAWTGSEEFIEGHKRAFEDMKIAKERGEKPPMHSSMNCYSVLTT